MNWKEHWDKKSDENDFSSMGRDAYSIVELFIYIKSIRKAFERFNENDTLLDVGGGKGFLSMAISPYVKSITLIDFSDAMIKKASVLTKEFENIHVFEDKLPCLENIQYQQKLFSKILVGSVIQYLNNYNDIESSFFNLSKVCEENGKILFTHNPDILKKELFINSYNSLNWPKYKVQKAINFEKNDRFWLDYDILKDLAFATGYKKCEKISVPPKLFQSSHMFDFILSK